MKPETKKRIEKMLKDKRYWNVKRGKREIDFNRVIGAIREIQEGKFYDSYYWPRVVCFCSLVKSRHRDKDWQAIRFGYNKLIFCDWSYEIDLVGWFEFLYREKMESKWGEWFDIPSKQEIQDLAPLVLDQEFEDGAKQPAFL